MKVTLQLDESEVSLLEKKGEPRAYGDCVSVKEFLDTCVRHNNLIIEGSFVGQAVHSQATGPLAKRSLTVVGSLTKLKFK